MDREIPPTGPSVSDGLLHAVSLFSNCGAGDVGYRDAGFQFDVIAELDPRRLSVALLNHRSAIGVVGDLRNTWTAVVERWREVNGSARPALLAACPPCQGMSSARSGRGSHTDPVAGGRDDRNLLVTVIASVAAALRPRAIVVENVPAFLTRAVPHPADGRPISAAWLLADALSADYKLFAIVADLADWGVPQTRKRAFLTLIRNDEVGLVELAEYGRTPFPRPAFTRDYGGEPVSMRRALAELSLGALDASNAESARDPIDELHRVPVWNDKQYRMVAAIPADTGAGAWRNTACSSCRSETTDPETAVCDSCGAPLLRPIVLDKSTGSHRLIKGFRSTSYTRMRPDEPASTVTTASGHIGSDKTLHPWQNRVLSMRECAVLQTLPMSFDWGDALAKWGHTNVREMIGEAVPPLFTLQHGHAIAHVLDGRATAPLLVEVDQRVTRATAKLDGARSLRPALPLDAPASWKR